MGLKDMTEIETKSMMKDLDLNKDGKISPEEF
jgi:Ca2+-binding EF-hand superfamily protein